MVSGAVGLERMWAFILLQTSPLPRRNRSYFGGKDQEPSFAPGVPSQAPFLPLQSAGSACGASVSPLGETVGAGYPSPKRLLGAVGR